MKKLAGVLVALCAVINAAQAQYDPKAREVLDQMSARYQEIDAYKADFSYVLSNKMESVREEFKGTVAVKGDKYRLKMGGQEIYNNGNTMWTYFEDMQEVNVDNYNAEDGDMSPSKIYNAYKDGFKYIYLASESGGSTHMIDLVPDDKSSQYYKVRLKINKNNNQLKGWDIYDKAGNIISYNISNFDPNVSLKDSYFEFDEANYPGVEVIDLR